MQLSTLKNKVPQALVYKWGKTEIEQAHYFEIGNLVSTVMENLKTGMIRILDDRCELLKII